jgi:hypothetical protein
MSPVVDFKFPISALTNQNPPICGPSEHSPHLTHYSCEKRQSPVDPRKRTFLKIFCCMEKNRSHRLGSSREYSRCLAHVHEIAERRISGVGFPALDFQLALSFQLWFEFAFEVALPVAGVLFEIANWKFAKRINVGCFVAAGCFWLIAAIWDHSDPFFGVLLIIAIGLFLIAGLSELVYRMTRGDSYVANSR